MGELYGMWIISQTKMYFRKIEFIISSRLEKTAWRINLKKARWKNLRKAEKVYNMIF